MSIYITLEKVVILIIGFLLGALSIYLFLYIKQTVSEKKIKERIDELKRQEKEIIISAEKKAIEILEKAREEREKIISDLQKREERISQKEEILDNKEKELLKEKEDLKNKLLEIEEKEKIIEKLKKDYEEKLENIANLSKEEALKIILENIEKEKEEILIQRISKMLNYQKEEIEKKANEIITEALPRYSRSVANEINLSIVSLPNEEMKGRIIGKEGRNIRYFEKLSGVQIIIDETPEVVTLSSFDPIKREIAKIALEKLIQDGRIHPASIEEALLKAKEEIDEQIKLAGRNAALELGIIDLPEEILQLMGRLKFRFSYGQNVLQHSIEVGFFSRMIAEELNLDKDLAKKAGFLHDIGKSVSHEIEGSHLEIGIKILEKYGVDEKVILAMRSHHETYPFALPEAYVVLAADAISSKRLGARSETLEAYLQRLENLEKIANSFQGVEKAYSISGGREVWVFVKPEEINDLEMFKLAKKIAEKIEQSIRYPGEIKVVVIRENKAIEYAR
jgi:ribonuclease Y